MTWGRCAVWVLMAVLLTRSASGQSVRPGARGETGLELPSGPMTPGNQQAVTVSDEDGRATVGRLHVRVGSGAIVLLPDGQLVVRRQGEFDPTERKFEPLDKPELLKKLAAEFPGFKTKASSHYVFVYSSSDEFQFGTSRILESMLPGVKAWAESAKIDVKDPAGPLVAVMFRS